MNRCLTFTLFLLFECPAVSDTAGANYLVTELKSDPRFTTSVTRLFACKIPGPPVRTIRIPAELYPEKSVIFHEEGTVVMQLIFDSDWCVHKATVLKSSGYYRLDNVSLQFVMTIKFSFAVKDLIDGRPAITFPIAWGASQAKWSMPWGSQQH